ncbi:hypothetical protein BDK51DRAFT_39371 [Blyttiomyces helicus]|uniref:Uncharacterized protein n=1 Tax=Blyttiomyces helicus TaxID=388810 RepID=A0A4V1IQE4_9FUNG|nr:hypothetical protein BDK51DRAFT_39371 [Blyttiomyces helicus]|eukprot:RKO86267.1 hypothetical protein BDK51DRAFT_39371 [Blyttiomyces helicus]
MKFAVVILVVALLANGEYSKIQGADRHYRTLKTCAYPAPLPPRSSSPSKTIPLANISNPIQSPHLLMADSFLALDVHFQSAAPISKRDGIGHVHGLSVSHKEEVSSKRDGIGRVHGLSVSPKEEEGPPMLRGSFPLAVSRALVVKTWVIQQTRTASRVVPAFAFTSFPPNVAQSTFSLLNEGPAETLASSRDSTARIYGLLVSTKAPTTSKRDGTARIYELSVKEEAKKSA